MHPLEELLRDFCKCVIAVQKRAQFYCKKQATEPLACIGKYLNGFNQLGSSKRLRILDLVLVSDIATSKNFRRNTA